MLEIFIYSYITSIFFFSAGILFSKKLIDFEFTSESNFFQIGINGIIFLSFLGLLINFFTELNKTVNTIIILIFFLYILVNNKLIIKKFFIYSIFSAVICTLIITLDNTYRPDAGLYHLPYTKILNEEKIIFGLSNIHFRFGHTSIMQYLAAINNNWIFYDKGILVPLSVIYSYFILYYFQEIKYEKNKLILLFNFIIFSFLCLKINRYSDFGNDAPANIFYFYLVSLTLKNYKKFSKENLGEILVISVFIIFNKITLFLSTLIPLSILFCKEKIIYINSRIFIFLIMFVFSFFLKNFIISGCLAFPIEKTCIKDVFWYDFNSKRGSNAKVTMLENEAWTKSWSDQKTELKPFNEYLSNLGWIKVWLENHGKRSFIKIIPFLFFLIIILIFLIILSRNKKIPHTQIQYMAYNKLLITLLIINLIGICIWFLKFPLFRYGYSYLISFVGILILIILYKKILAINLIKLKKIINYFAIGLFIILISKNLIRITKNYDNVYNDYPWPRIYSDDYVNIKKNNIPQYKNNKIIFYQSEEGICYYNTGPCTHFLNSQFSIDEIEFKFLFSYKVFYFSRKNNF